MTTSEHSEPDKPLAVPLSDQLGLVVDAAVLDCWKANYGLAKTPAEIAALWGNWAPSGAILALRAAVAEIERIRAEALRMADRCDDIADHTDAHTCALLRDIAVALRS